ncbi:helix-turn-helix transcriptional regulator [Paenibacillus frigoriresistens]|uniref:helix-turn-helix transcriptional regulator n=1 Tax=Paenibacillus alginolyticus TaxID=59839 RepID=UPI0015667C66|nr:AraC family transcriptional regulator [Paenibacillus frigoriresistens]NRF94487.1 helix-turn-helix transcriptional regulator [Paenibacillus frigoriresistens]
MSVNETILDHKALLIKAIKAKESEYDSQVCMLRRPFHSPGYHTTLTAKDHPTTHPTYQSLLYAVGLLNTEMKEYEQRAYDIIGRLLSLQDRNPLSDTYGIWPWFYEEPLTQMAPPDWNWADFCGKELLLAVLRHGHKLPETLKDQIRESVSFACDAIIRRNVGPSYTNITIMGAFVTLIAGELYERKDYADYGLERLKKLQQYTANLGTFQEFNSPAYSVIAIVELSKIGEYSLNSRAKEITAELLDMVWRMVVEHYHPVSQQWAGPHNVLAVEKSYLEGLYERDGQIGAWIEQWLPEMGSDSLHVQLNARQLLVLQETLSQLEREIREQQPGYPLAVKGLLLHMFTQLGRYQTDIGVVQQGSGDRKRVVESILSYLMEHYQESLRIEDLCGQFHLSRSYLCRIFKQDTGVSVNEFLIAYRINKAKEILQGSDLPITEVAASVGFQDISHFCHTFKRLTELTPSGYRNLHHSI